MKKPKRSNWGYLKFGTLAPSESHHRRHIYEQKEIGIRTIKNCGRIINNKKGK